MVKNNYLFFYQGITSRLEYIKDIGVEAIWLSPMFQSPMYDFGYDIADFYAVHDEYGTMEDFEALLKKADDLGKKIYSIHNCGEIKLKVNYSGSFVIIIKFMCFILVKGNRSKAIIINLFL